MIKEILCTFSSEAQVVEAASKIRDAGVKPDDLIVVTRPSEVGDILRPTSELARHAAIGAAAGAIIGWLLGIGMVVYSGSLSFIMWGGVSVIMLSQAFGWAIFLAIVGAGGVFAPQGLSARVEHQFEEDVAEGKILVALRVTNKNEINNIAASLYDAGAIRVHQSSLFAA